LLSFPAARMRFFTCSFSRKTGPSGMPHPYNYGWWRVLFSPYEGYIHLIPRLTAALALLMPMVYAPLVENLVAIAIQALPVNILLSRSSSAWGSIRFRAALAGLYLLLPNTREIFGTVSEVQWFLALCAFLLLVASIPSSTGGRVFSVALWVFCGLTGPFSLLLLPIALFMLLRHRYEMWRRTGAAIFLAGALVQGICLLAHTSNRRHPLLGANVEEFIRIVSTQIYLATTIGTNALSANFSTFAICLLFAIGTLAWFLCARVSGVEMRCLIFLAAAILFASLASPVVFPASGVTAWQLPAGAPGIRYWFFPCLAFAWALAYGVCSSRQLVRIIAACFLFFLPVGIVRDYKYPAFADMEFAQYAQLFDRAPHGSTVTIPINPGGPWVVRLYKH
jgi:hypothetical protein